MTYLFKPYTSAPKTTDKNAIRRTYGGYAHCPARNKTTGYTLPNCTAFAHAMWLKTITDAKGLDEARRIEDIMCWNDAEVYWNYNDGFDRGQTPKLNAIMVWNGKGSLAGHVMTVTEIMDNGDVVATGSNYSGSVFYTKTYYKSNNYNFNPAKYTFMGFIYCPYEFVYKTGTPVARNSKVDQIQVIADSLNVRPTASTAGYSEGYCVPGIYNVYDSFKDGNYTWYRIGNEMWIANNGTWATFLPKTEPKYNLTMTKITKAQKQAMEAWAKAEGVTVTITEA